MHRGKTILVKWLKATQNIQKIDKIKLRHGRSYSGAVFSQDTLTLIQLYIWKILRRQCYMTKSVQNIYMIITEI